MTAVQPATGPTPIDRTWVPRARGWSAVTGSDPFEPVLGDAIGPTRARRALSGAGLFAVLVGLGIVAAAVIGLAIVLLWAAFTAALG